MSLKIFSGRASCKLAEDICRNLGITLGGSEVVTFADGEFEVRFCENIRGSDIFIVQSTHQPTENLFELLCWIRAARGTAVRSVTLAGGDRIESLVRKYPLQPD